MSYEEHIEYHWPQETRATAGNLRLLESINVRLNFALYLGFIGLIVRYLEGDWCGLFLGTMSVCV